MKNLIAILIVLAFSSAAIGQHWTYPGDIKSHLQNDHGISDGELSRLSSEEQLDLHDALHISKARKTVPTIVMHSSTSCGPCQAWWANNRQEWKRVGWFVRKVNEIKFNRPVPWFEITDSDGARFTVQGPLNPENFRSAKAAVPKETAVPREVQSIKTTQPTKTETPFVPEPRTWLE